MPKDNPEITASDVVEIVRLLNQTFIHIPSIRQVIMFTESSTRPNHSPGPVR
jgi:hypothetical protein